MKIFQKTQAFIQKKTSQTIPLIYLHGIIMNDSNKLCLKAKIREIDKAFSVAKDKIFLSINSPGGAPGQSDLLFTYIKNEATQKNIKIYSFIEDYGASGGYWLAILGDEVYCLTTSIIGSIGVISGGFGLHEVLKEYHIERRLYTAGDSKNRNDTFSPLTDEDKQYTQDILEKMHHVFIAHVKKYRPHIHEDVFDARVAIGQQAQDYGLVDGITDMFSYRDKYFPKHKIVTFEKNKLLQLNPFKNFGLQNHHKALLLMQ